MGLPSLTPCNSHRQGAIGTVLTPAGTPPSGLSSDVSYGCNKPPTILIFTDLSPQLYILHQIDLHQFVQLKIMSLLM